EPPADRDRQHGEDVERAEAEDGPPVVENADEHRHEGNGTGARENSYDDVVAAVPRRAPRDHRPSVASSDEQPTSPDRTHETRLAGGSRMEPRGLEPLTFWLPAR